ncbi:Na+/melibiose symporter [Nocardioides sp. YR527]|uniref:MFS transporter n=1 Tax=Nocardioides sp. YR527 TaxID=1881028 RepID=UPI000888E7D6|nr:MFS transporter [Nocardioides sp. YR527]SDL35258.1 Na+/melibiose symporter [Nocardioides sp. YR527]
MSTTIPTAPPRQLGPRRITLLVALAVFAQESMWNFYDSQVPPLLREHLASAALVGFIMGMDNLLGIFIQPWMANRSDRTRTRWGRRMPYLAVGMPLAALLFVTLPHTADSLPLLIVVIVAFALVSNSFKPIGEALVPDFIAPERRSRANAAVKIASSLTVIVAALVSILLVDDHPALAFAVIALITLVSITVLCLSIRDSSSPGYQAAVAEDAAEETAEASTTVGQARIRDTIREIVRDPDRSRLLLIVAILVFGSAWAGSRALVTPYGMETLGLSRGDAGGLTLPSGVAFLLAAYPTALLAERFGRLRTMIGGMAIFAAAMLLGTLVQTPTGTVVAFCIGAAGASAFLVNAVVVLWNLAPSARVFGTYAALYAVGWQGGAFLGPALIGGAVDILGWQTMLLDIAVLAAVAVAIVVRIDRLQRRGDVERAV